MADIYTPNLPPSQYDAAWLYQELNRLAAFVQEMEVPLVKITPSAVAPVKPREGMVANADGTNWNPGGGAGLYQYLAGAWVKL